MYGGNTEHTFYSLTPKLAAEAKSRSLSPEQRLRFHQAQSGPKMAELKSWLTEQIEQHKVNPFEYLTELQKHTDELSSDHEMWMPWNYQGMLQSSDAP